MNTSCVSSLSSSIAIRGGYFLPKRHSTLYTFHKDVRMANHPSIREDTKRCTYHMYVSFPKSRLCAPRQDEVPLDLS